MSNEVTKKPESSIVNLDYLKDDDLDSISDGSENLGADARVFPFLKIAQASTDQAKKGHASKIEGLEAGMFFDNVSNKVLGESVRVVPLYMYNMYTVWGGKLGDFKRNILPEDFESEKSGYVESTGKWIKYEPGKPQIDGNIIERVQYYRNFFVLLPDHLDCGALLFSITSVGLTHARRWLSMMDNKRIDGVPQKKFKQIWTLSTTFDTRDSGDSYQLGSKQKTSIEFDGYIGEDLLPIVKSALKSIQSITSFTSVAAENASHEAHEPSDNSDAFKTDAAPF